MRIKNVGKCKFVFKGGSLEAGQVAVFKGAAEEIGKALLRAYPKNLSDLDNIKKEDIVDVVFEEEPKVEGPKATAKPVAKKANKKSKKK